MPAISTTPPGPPRLTCPTHPPHLPHPTRLGPDLHVHVWRVFVAAVVVITGECGDVVLRAVLCGWPLHMALEPTCKRAGGDVHAKGRKNTCTEPNGGGGECALCQIMGEKDVGRTAEYGEGLW